MRSLLTVVLMIATSPVMAQEIEEPKLELGYGSEPASQVDESALGQRVDELTEAVNQLAENDRKLDERITALENSKVTTSRVSFALKSTLKPIDSVRSWGSPTKLSGGGCTGNPVALRSSAFTERIVSVSPPVVTSVQQGPPVVTSVQVSEPTVSYSTPIVSTPIASAPIAMAPLPAAPAPVQRRDVVRMPVARVTTQNVRYEPLQGGDCPGGVCPVNRGSAAVRQNGFLGSRLGSRLRSRSSGFQQ